MHSERARLHGLSSDNVQALKQKERILDRLRDTERVSQNQRKFWAWLRKECREWTRPRIVSFSSRKPIFVLKLSLEVRN